MIKEPFLIGSRKEEFPLRKISTIYLNNDNFIGYSPTRIPKEIGDEIRIRLNNNKKKLKLSLKVANNTEKILKKSRNSFTYGKVGKLFESILDKNKKQTTIQNVNLLLDIYFPGINVISTVDDIYGQDYEEYGIEDIEETRHLSLQIKSSIGSTVLLEHFTFGDVNLSPSRYKKESTIQSIQEVYPTFNNIDLVNLERILNLPYHLKYG